MDNDLPYRTPFNTSPAKQASSVSSMDEANFSSIRAIRNDMEVEMNRLKDVTLLDLTESELKLKSQIKANQIAYAILEPLLETLDVVLVGIENKWRV